jgi:FAD/FMN-containing dehydrogenase
LKPESLTIDDFFERCHRINPELFSLIEQRGGSISAEHGVGLLKRDFLPFSRSGAEIGLMRELKRVFDPSGIMNPGKLFSV